MIRRRRSRDVRFAAQNFNLYKAEQAIKEMLKAKEVMRAKCDEALKAAGNFWNEYPEMKTAAKMVKYIDRLKYREIPDWTDQINTAWQYISDSQKEIK